MSLGYIVDDEDEKRGTTLSEERPTRYAEVEMKYPCYIVDCTDQMIPAYKVEVIKNMFKTNVDISSLKDPDESRISIYFKNNDTTVSLGTILSLQARAFLRLTEDLPVTGYFSESEKLEGDYLYVLTC